jgi:glycosyltransferase involved in cell wall biosynthesis
MMTRPSPRALYLSFYFPPSRASGVYRARATANLLAERGWDVTALTAPWRFIYDVAGSVDEELATTVDARIRVEQPDLNFYPWEEDLRRFGRLRRLAPTVRHSLHEWEQRVFPERYASWGLAAVWRALRLHARRRFDVVLATGNPFASFAAAWLFHRLTRVPYVIDYRDSWTLNLFTDSPAYAPNHPAWTWERRAISGASSVVFVNDALRGWHAERYPAHADRMMVVPNGWDPDLMAPTPAAPRAGAQPSEPRPLRFGYLGTLTAVQPLDELAAAFRRARQHPELADAELHLHGHIGFVRGSPVEPIKERLGARYDGEATVDGDPGIRLRGPVSKTDVAGVYQECDVLVFLAAGARYITSGKIFEYMATGRPIVSVHAPDIAAREVLEGYPLWFNANSLDVEEVAQSMIAAGKAARDLGPHQRAAALRHAERYARHIVLQPLEARLRALAHRPPARAPGDAGQEAAR